MGYTTEFNGKFSVNPPLTPAQVKYLKAFNETRRMQRIEGVAENMPDDARLAVGLPIGKDAGYFVGGGGDFGQAKDNSIVNYNSPPSGQPGLWCQWRPNDAGDSIGWDGGEKFCDYTKWLQYIVDRFLKPWGCALSGHISWSGEGSGDHGVIYARGHQVEAVASTLENIGPGWGEESWEKLPEVSK